MPTSKKTAKKPASKSVVGGLKSKPKWQIVFIILVALLLVSSIAYFGYGKYKAHNLTAKAANWSHFNSGYTGTSTAACKTSVGSAFGPLWKITTVVSKPANLNLGVNVNIYRGSSMISSTAATAWWGGTVTSITSYSSQLYPDTWAVSMGANNKGGEANFGRVSSLVTC